MELINTKTLKLAFLGIGWIGKNRMEAILKTGLAVPAIISDKNTELLDTVRQNYPDAVLQEEIQYNTELDGVVIATPNSQHSEQAVAAMDAGIPVFCQKPLARNLPETELVVNSAKKNNVLLGVDFSYRDTEAFKKVAEIIKSGEIGEIFSADMNFHNAYGPGKSWCYDMELSGGGAVIDLGIHLIDLLQYLTGFPELTKSEASLYSKGIKVNHLNIVEDYASVNMIFKNDLSARLTCSWNVSVGQDAVIELTLYGTKGGASFRNVNGSFFDFNAELYKGNRKEILVTPPDNWMGRTAVEWTKRLINDKSYDPSASEFLKTAAIIDNIYGRT